MTTVLTPPLSPGELAELKRLYTTHGAWTNDELQRYSTRAGALLAAGVLTKVHTVIGPLYVLTAEGRWLVFDTRDNAHSLTRQQDRAYLRLCLAHRGWTLTTPATTRALKDYVGNRQLVEIDTGAGIALAGGQMTSGGYRAINIQEIGDRLRSPALHDDFQVILFTPRPGRGQATSQRYASFLQLDYLIPGPVQATHYGVPSRVQYVPAPPPWDDDYPWDAAHLSGATAAQMQRSGTTLPDSSLQILTQPKSVRIARFWSDLRMDLAIGDTQLRRHYGLTIEDIEGAPYVDALLRPMHSNTTVEFHMAVYLASPALASRNDAALMHYIGVGEMRRQLNVVSPSQWTVSTAGKHRTEEPDALWHRGTHDVAIEYDAGHYKLTLVLRKLEAFSDRGFRETIWGVPSERRRAFLQTATAGRQSPKTLVTEWWHTKTRVEV